MTTRRKLGAIVLICFLALHGSATTIVILVTPTLLAFGADGKRVQTDLTMKSIKNDTVEKITVVQNRILVAVRGLDQLKDGDAVLFDGISWVHSLEASKSKSITALALAQAMKEDANIIKALNIAVKQSKQVLGVVPDPQLPLLSYYVGAFQNGKPQVHVVEIFVDWSTRTVDTPRLSTMYPNDETIKGRENLFVNWYGATKDDDDGVFQLGLKDSSIQKDYLAKHRSEVVAYLEKNQISNNEALRLEELLLRLEITHDRKDFDFPGLIYSVAAHAAPLKQIIHERVSQPKRNQKARQPAVSSHRFVSSSSTAKFF